MSDMNVIKGVRNCSGGMGVEGYNIHIGRAAQGASAADIHESHMDPTPAAVLGWSYPMRLRRVIDWLIA